MVMLAKTKLGLAFAAMSLVILLLGCPGPNNPPSARRIGFVVTTQSNPYFVDMINAAKEEAAKHPNLELIVQSPDVATDNERQIQIVENLVGQRVSAICVVPADSKSIVSAIKKANE